MPALYPITRTSIPHDPDQSRWFSAKHAGTCAWTGLPFWAGERIMRYHGAYVAARTISLLCFTGAGEGGSWSDWERAPADPSVIPDRTVEGDRLWLVSSDGTIRAFMCRGGKFEGGKAGQLGGGSKKSRAQLGALLAGTVAYRIDRMSESPVEALLREQRGEPAPHPRGAAPEGIDLYLEDLVAGEPGVGRLYAFRGDRALVGWRSGATSWVAVSTLRRAG